MPKSLTDTTPDEADDAEVGDPSAPNEGPKYGAPCLTENGLRLRYLPFMPHPKQAVFLASTCIELFFGGSGGPGKSAALLMAAAQFVDIPGYAALILRTKLTDLTQEGALISMAHVWWDDNPDATYNANERKWSFKGGGSITFGYLSHEKHRGRYRGSEYQFIGWDELGEFANEDDYTFLFSRLRRPKGMSREEIVKLHGEAPDGMTLLDVPLRVRSASNPGGPGMAWVKRRFVDESTRQAPYLPAKYTDNPAIDAEEYEMALSKLSDIERRRMGDGDWSIEEIPGALWKLSDIEHVAWDPYEFFEPDKENGPSEDEALLLAVAQFERTIVGIDPSVGEGSGDECGIVGGGLRSDGTVVILEDESYAAHPDNWSKTAVRLYHRIGATAMVIEDNQGKVLLETAIRSAADILELPLPKIIRKNAKGTKEARAGLASQPYKITRPNHDDPQNPIHAPMVVHAEGLRGGRLEAQMVGWVPGQRGQKSPDRVDALAWLVREFLFPNVVDNTPQSTVKQMMMQRVNS